MTSAVQSHGCGYMSEEYARSLAEFGAPLGLPASGGWMLKRPIPNFPCFDAMGCYPIFSCSDWQGLETDLEALAGELVSVAAVIDPFGEHDEALLKRCFPDLVLPFKQHFVADLQKDPERFVSERHLRNVKKAIQNVEVEHTANPVGWLQDWQKLYAILIQRHSIKGIAAFSHQSFARQLEVPGIYASRALHQGQVVGMLLWYVQKNVVYYHLGAYTELGYELRSSFALFWNALAYFQKLGLEWLNVGAGAGLNKEATDGLTVFKQGWSTGTRLAYFCGRIFDREKYEQLFKARNIPATPYFPAYRKGEFA